MNPAVTIGADLPDLPGALCDGMYGELWFPESGCKGNDAKKVCRRCPVQAACLKYAIENPVDGIWGGTSAEQRRTIARRRAA